MSSLKHRAMISGDSFRSHPEVILRAWGNGPAEMAGKIFINYRRGDDLGYAQALYGGLEPEFMAGDLFRDIEVQVASADVILVVIGSRWADLLAARANGHYERTSDSSSASSTSTS